jgi:hypothetical protein
MTRIDSDRLRLIQTDSDRFGPAQVQVLRQGVQPHHSPQPHPRRPARGGRPGSRRPGGGGGGGGGGSGGGGVSGGGEVWVEVEGEEGPREEPAGRPAAGSRLMIGRKEGGREM